MLEWDLKQAPPLWHPPDNTIVDTCLKPEAGRETAKKKLRASENYSMKTSHAHAHTQEGEENHL